MQVSWVRVVLDIPRQEAFDYRCEQPVEIGQRVIVPFGSRQLVGVVIELLDAPALDLDQIRDVDQVLDDLPAFSASWLALAQFASRYYQRSLGEVILPVLPNGLRKPAAYLGKRAAGGPVARADRKKRPPAITAVSSPIVLNAEQQFAVRQICASNGYSPYLLHGITGSGKTEVYLHAALRFLQQGRQILMLVPEINLTPQLETAVRARFADLVAPEEIAIFHSGLADGERLKAWADAQRGKLKVLLGTRMAIFAPLDNPGLIIVDEEHDASYKQQEGLRYSARDLAVWRAHHAGIPLVLGSATPSLETWHHALSGRYTRLVLEQRAKTRYLPQIRLVDTRKAKLVQGFEAGVLGAIGDRLERGEQSMVFLNRRGYAPVMHCAACGWVSQCSRCSVHTVLHRNPGSGYQLQCHHCGFQSRVPSICPDCGNQDLQPLGRGTQRVEEFLQETFPAARIQRIDADSTRLKGSALRLFDQVHTGNIDILVGTQMVAKGHDFKRLGLVAVLNADSMLFSADFRAPERLFAQLLQVAGRAGRHAEGGQVLIQTGYPDHTVYQTLLNNDFPAFADDLLAERQDTGLPPFTYQALITAEAKSVKLALTFLESIRECAVSILSPDGQSQPVNLYDPVPLRILRVAHVERAQLLVESISRPALQRFLQQWLPQVQAIGQKQRMRYFIEVDPLEI
ncbi:primosomal protein N' [Advenella sp. S44]|uniref:primosomal protein N' n=1 Tax=Advenella sp. S44 TaxID=1982755 RepID=UPI000C29A5D6|nr:primosomal protein N' [Advenella sp. S44]PJX25570.1 primosomal protein N' [Advenella sp. S44]